MNTRLFFFTLTLVFIAAVCFAVGPQEEKSSVTAAKGVQYGGTLTVLAQRQNGDPPSPAQDDCQVQAIDGWLAATQEHLLLGNIKEYGGMGSGEVLRRM